VILGESPVSHRRSPARLQRTIAAHAIMKDTVRIARSSALLSAARFGRLLFSEFRRLAG
jgi:hypothetical protein